MLVELDVESNDNSTCTDLSTFSLAYGANSSQSLALESDKEEVDDAPPPWLNRHFCFHVHWFLSQCLQISDLEEDFEIGKGGLLF